MRTATALALTSFLVLLALTPARADDSDIFGANIQPNIMILFDSSGSMGDSIVSHPYDPATSYPVVNSCGSSRNEPCDTPVVYRRTRSSPATYNLYQNTIAQVSSQSARDALSTDGFWSGRIGGSRVNLFLGNYLNYQLGFCPSAPCSEDKIDIAKRVIKNLLDNVNGVRFGVMKFGNNGTQGQGGGQMMATIGTDVVTMKAAVDTISPSGFTPLGEQMYDAGQYYKGLSLRNGTSFPTPIQLECQPNFVILMTDGLQNGTLDVRVQATARRTQDHAGNFSGTQNVIVHTIGFGITDANERDAANDVLQQAATNGGGSFFYADDAKELEAALQEAIRQIVAATFTFATPVLPTTSTTGSSRAYLAAFQSDPSSPFWRGFLKAFQRGADGLVPVDPNTGVPDPAALVWEAGARLNAKAASSRTIYTAIGGTRYDFLTSTAALTEAMLGVSSPSERAQVIEFTRGTDAYDADVDGNTTEERSWKLGDIFHSTPVLVTPPGLALNDASYTAFKQSNASRTAVLIAGSNDGMLHAFRESDGEELWAFIPPDLLGRLTELTTRSAEHPFFVDSSPIAVDIKTQASGWRTIVVFGLRRGGQHYYALDITDTTSPSFLWSFTDPKMGETWSEPAVGRVKVGGVETFVAFVGGGYDTAENNNTGKAFFVIDLATGTKLWEYWNNGSADDRQYLNFSLAANATAADLTNDGLVDKVYIGDVGGQVWKFDVSAGATVEWTGKRLFAAAPSQTNPPAAGEYYPAQGIYGAPSLALDDSLKLWVFFGTGDRNHPNNTGANRFYGFKDTTMINGDPLEEAELVNAADPNATAGQIAAAPGWFVPLDANEKVLATANIFNKVVLFSTFTPTTTIACDSGGGTAKLYALQMETGFAAIDFTTGEALTTTSSSQTRFITIGTGIASMPVVVITPQGTTVSTSVVTATTSQQLPSNPVPPPPFLKRFLFWRELMGS